MTKQIIKSIVAASIMLAMLFDGNAAFANPIYGKNNIKKKVLHPKTVRINVTKKGLARQASPPNKVRP